MSLGFCLRDFNCYGTQLFSFDFDHQAQDVRRAQGVGIEASDIGTVVGLSPSRVSRILSQGL